MKKCIMIMMCLSTLALQSAENSHISPQQFSSISFGIGNVNYRLTKGYNYIKLLKPDLIIVGRNQQQKLQEPNLGDSGQVGEIDPTHTVYYLSKASDSASDDDTYKSYKTTSNKVWKIAECAELKSQVFAIVEPRIMYQAKNDKEPANCTYFTTRAHSTNENCFSLLTFYGEDAIDKAASDLAMCYEKALAQGLVTLKDKKNKKIAFACLGADVGFPREKAAAIAVAAVLKFMKENPDAYILIEFFVKKRSEFKLYDELLFAAFQNQMR